MWLLRVVFVGLVGASLRDLAHNTIVYTTQAPSFSGCNVHSLWVRSSRRQPVSNPSIVAMQKLSCNGNLYEALRTWSDNKSSGVAPRKITFSMSEKYKMCDFELFVWSHKIRNSNWLSQKVSL